MAGNLVQRALHYREYRGGRAGNGEVRKDPVVTTALQFFNMQNHAFWSDMIAAGDQVIPWSHTEEMAITAGTESDGGTTITLRDQPRAERADGTKIRVTPVCERQVHLQLMPGASSGDLHAVVNERFRENVPPRFLLLRAWQERYGATPNLSLTNVSPVKLESNEDFLEWSLITPIIQLLFPNVSWRCIYAHPAFTEGGAPTLELTVPHFPMDWVDLEGLDGLRTYKRRQATAVLADGIAAGVSLAQLWAASKEHLTDAPQSQWVILPDIGANVIALGQHPHRN